MVHVVAKLFKIDIFDFKKIKSKNFKEDDMGLREWRPYNGEGDDKFVVQGYDFREANRGYLKRQIELPKRQ